MNKYVTFTILFLVLFLCNASLSLGKDTYSYEILNDDRYGTAKRSVDVRLDRRISNEQLESLAKKIKSVTSKNFKKTFILYYLPYQKPGAGAWASTHFEPSLNVEIWGATVDDVKKFHTFSPAAGGKVIGEWIWDRPDLSHKITVFKKDGIFLINEYYKEGQQYTKKLKTSNVATGLRLEEEQASNGEYYIINKKGQLEFRDSEPGAYLILPPEKPAKRPGA